MEVRQGYKRTAVGDIPEAWEVLPLSKIGQIKTGPFGTLLRASEYSGHEGVPLISVREVGDGAFRVTEHTPRVPEAVVKRLPEFVLRVGDIVFGRKGAVDRSALVTENQQGWFLGSDAISVRPLPTGHPPYLAAQFRSGAVKSWLVQNAVGTTMASMNQGILGRALIPYAPLSEQRAIAAVLSDMDALLGGLERLVAKKRDLRHAAIQQLLTGAARLPGFSGSWNKWRLSDVAEILKGSGLSKSITRASGSRLCILYGELFTTYGRVVAEVMGRTDSPDGLPSLSGDVLMPSSTTTTGADLATASALLQTGVLLGGDILVLRQRSRAYDPIFLSNYLTYTKRQEISELTQGITIHHLYGKDLKGLAIELPCLSEQQAIAAVISDLDAELSALEARRDKTRAIKQAMMQELLTGRTRLV